MGAAITVALYIKYITSKNTPSLQSRQTRSNSPGNIYLWDIISLKRFSPLRFLKKKATYVFGFSRIKEWRKCMGIEPT